VPAALQATAVDEWGKAISVVNSLDHLEGRDVGVFADGFVVASPNNEAYETITIASGVATLPKPYVTIHIGLPFISDMEHLDLDTPQGQSLANQGKLVTSVNIYFEKTRGVFVGGKNPDDDADNTTSDPLYELTEFKPRSTETMDNPPALKTGIEELQILSEWNSHGRIFLRQVDPLPMSVLGAVIEGLF
jgi:hypothetical protein